MGFLRPKIAERSEEPELGEAKFREAEPKTKGTGYKVHGTRYKIARLQDSMLSPFYPGIVFLLL